MSKRHEDRRARQAVWLGNGDWPEWERFVARHPWGGLYQTSTWRRVIESSYGHIKAHVCAVRDGDSDEIVAGLPVYVVRSWLLGNRLVCIPFATLSDPLVSSAADFELMMPRLLELRRSSRARYLEIRTHRGAPLLQHRELRVSVSYKHHFLKLNGSLESVGRGLSRIVQRSVKKAAAAGISVRKARGKEDLQAFHRLLFETRRRLGLPPIPMRFFDRLWDGLTPSGAFSLLIACQGDTPAGGLLSIKWGRVYALEYIGDSDALRGTGVMHILYWEALKDAMDSGCETMSFGRTYRGNRGLLQFKEQWGTESEDLCTFYHPPTTHKDAEDRQASWQYRLINLLARRAPVPAARVLGEFCYRHMG